MHACILLLVVVLNAVLPVVARAHDAPWHSKPVRIIVPGGVAGVTDIRARWLAERLAPALGQPVIVENKPGAGGNIGTEAGARSASDGYTLVIVHQGTMTMNPHLYRHTGYDALKDFTPITRIGVGPLLLAVHPSLPATSVAELVRLAKARPGQLSFGSPGVGTPPYMAEELFLRAAGIAAIHVPYRGGGQAVSDLVGGHITWSIDGLNVQLPHVKAGRLRALAVTGAQRVSVLPDVPTLAEAGIRNYEFTGWVGIAVPAGTSAFIVTRLYQEIAAILATPEGREWFASNGLLPGGDSPEAFAALIRAEHAKWGEFIRDNDIKAE